MGIQNLFCHTKSESYLSHKIKDTLSPIYHHIYILKTLAGKGGPVSRPCLARPGSGQYRTMGGQAGECQAVIRLIISRASPCAVDQLHLLCIN